MFICELHDHPFVSLISNETMVVPWSWDAKKIHILNYLVSNNKMGGIRNTFLRMGRKDIDKGSIGSKEITPILEELLMEDFILKETTAGGDLYRASPKGINFIEELKSIKEQYGIRFFFLDALDEPTDQVSTKLFSKKKITSIKERM